METKASKTAQIVDESGYAIKGAFVLVDVIPVSEPGGEPTYLESIHSGRVLQPGESLIYGGAAPTDMVKPRWIGSEWEETATPEEIAAAEAAKAQELETISGDPKVPTINERVEAMEDALLAVLMGGMPNV